MKTYEQFLTHLAEKESRGRYETVNEIGYLGKYQMGETALIDCGYYRYDGSTHNPFQDKFWTGKDGVKSKADFLNNHQAQENAIRDYMRIQWKYILAKSLDYFVGSIKLGLLITESGILAGAHLGGHKRLASFLKEGLDLGDRNKVPVSYYIKKFAGYETPFKVRKKLTGLKKDKSGKTVMYQLEEGNWISKDEAIKLFNEEMLYAVLVNGPNGLFLRTKPDKTTINNLS